MKTTKKLNPRFFVFAALLMVVAIAAFPRTALAGSTYNFNVALTPNYTARTPSNYIFGYGNWTGQVHYNNNPKLTWFHSEVTLVAGEPTTWFIARIAYVDANGNLFGMVYWAFFTDSNGNGYSTVNVHVPHGAVAAVLGLYDASHFFPPLQTMISDPDLGGDQPT